MKYCTEKNIFDCNQLICMQVPHLKFFQSGKKTMFDLVEEEIKIIIQTLTYECILYLTDLAGENHDQGGSSHRPRLSQSTHASSSNVGMLTASFLVMGDRF